MEVSGFKIQFTVDFTASRCLSIYFTAPSESPFRDFKSKVTAKEVLLQLCARVVKAQQRRRNPGLSISLKSGYLNAATLMVLALRRK